MSVNDNYTHLNAKRIELWNKFYNTQEVTDELIKEAKALNKLTEDFITAGSYQKAMVSVFADEKISKLEIKIKELNCEIEALKSDKNDLLETNLILKAVYEPNICDTLACNHIHYIPNKDIITPLLK